MKKYLVIALMLCLWNVAAAQDSTQTKSPKRQSFALLFGTSNMWYQNYMTRRDYLQNYTDFGIQYAIEVKPNVDLYATLLYGVKNPKDVASAGLGLRYYLLDRETHKKFRPFANFSGEVVADNSTRSTYSDVDLTGSIGAGFDFKIAGSLYGRAMANIGFPFFQIGKVDFTDGRGTYAHYTGGLVYEWGNKPVPAPAKITEPVAIDTDGDGIVDKEDKCPTVKGVQSNNGCPLDSDGDGIIDAEDKCPAVAGVRANAGCPADADGDGIIDAEDRCPTLAGVRENAGCPADADGDGIYDNEDACPSVAGIASLKGCPAPKDADGDGVIDADDLMPNVAGLAALQGVPENLVIYFNTDRFSLTAESISTLDIALTLLKAQPSLKLKVTGHTDSRQTVQYNVELSKNRVLESRNYLMKNGVKKKRMKLAWFSELVPAAPNTTVDGMKLNRRVEIQIVQ
ncbi:OmpA family protein [Aquirufa antheringensis]|uniref:OmpA family protein n=1 Tax=Aquirufa antheringensis TaxID=2516559 RepID=UPI001F9C3FE6|nr:OmpA family protein [Pseudarcicella sp. GAP-15]